MAFRNVVNISTSSAASASDRFPAEISPPSFFEESSRYGPGERVHFCAQLLGFGRAGQRPARSPCPCASGVRFAFTISIVLMTHGSRLPFRAPNVALRCVGTFFFQSFTHEKVLHFRDIPK